MLLTPLYNLSYINFIETKKSPSVAATTWSVTHRTVSEIIMNTKVDEGKLISGKEALIALANDQDVEYMDTSNTFKSLGWSNAFGLETNLFFSDRFKFRLKPRTITINGIEVPAPFEPKEGETIFIPANFLAQGYMECKYPTFEKHVFQFGAWRTEEEIKQVVAALRQVLGGSYDN